MSVDQRDVIDAEVVLHRRQLEELLQDRLGVEATLDLDDQLKAVLAVGQILDIADALELLGLDEVLDLLYDLLRSDEIGQLGDNDALLARRDALDPGRCAGAERPTSGEVGITDPFEANDLAAAGEIGAGHEPHQVVQRALRVGDEVTGSPNDLDEVVRGHVRCHPDGDTACAVDQQVREGGGHHCRLHQLVVVVGNEVDGLLIEPSGHQHGGRCESGLGVARRRGAVVHRPEVAVPIHQREPHGEGLGHADERVIDGGVTVRVVLAHHLADDTTALDVPTLRPEPELAHTEQDSSLHGLEPVAGVRQGARVDDRVGVLQERSLHLLLDVDVDDAFGEVCFRGRG